MRLIHTNPVASRPCLVNLLFSGLATRDVFFRKFLKSMVVDGDKSSTGGSNNRQFEYLRQLFGVKPSRLRAENLANRCIFVRLDQGRRFSWEWSNL